MKVTIPELSLVVLVGASGCGKSTFARTHFKATEVLSSDFCRGLVSDDEDDPAATNDAFEVLHFIARKRLAAGRLTVIDATNVQPESRKPLVALAREFHVVPVALVFNYPENFAMSATATALTASSGRMWCATSHSSYVVPCAEWNARGSATCMFSHVFQDPAQTEGLVIERQPLWNNLRHEHGPFDIFGDVHGCFDELVSLLDRLGYSVQQNGGELNVTPPAGRKAVFLGDLVDRGSTIPSVLRLVRAMVAATCSWPRPTRPLDWRPTRVLPRRWRGGKN